jgi:hypothetical protein
MASKTRNALKHGANAKEVKLRRYLNSISAIRSRPPQIIFAITK